MRRESLLVLALLAMGACARGELVRVEFEGELVSAEGDFQVSQTISGHYEFELLNPLQGISPYIGEHQHALLADLVVDGYEATGRIEGFVRSYALQGEDDAVSHAVFQVVVGNHAHRFLGPVEHTGPIFYVGNSSGVQDNLKQSDEVQLIDDDIKARPFQLVDYDADYDNTADFKVIPNFLHHEVSKFDFPMIVHPYFMLSTILLDQSRQKMLAPSFDDFAIAPRLEITVEQYRWISLFERRRFTTDANYRITSLRVVPEPHAAVLALFGALFAGLTRRRG